jgi:plasmid replication initiation protein
LKKLTDISFDFEETRYGRKVTSLKFIIKSSKKLIDEVCATTESNSISKRGNYSTELISEVKNIFKENITGLESKFILNTAKGDIHIIKEKYALSKKISKIENIVG